MKTTMVLCSVSDGFSIRDPNRVVLFLFDHKGPFSLDAVNAWLDLNRHMPGWDQIRARRKLYTLKSRKRFWRWIKTKRRDQHVTLVGTLENMP